MKTNFFIVIMAATLLASCTSGLPAQDAAATKDVPSEVPEQATMTYTPAVLAQELLVTEQTTVTETPTITPTQTPFRCAALLSPANEAQIPAIGRITFAWEPIRNASFYVLNITLPSGATFTLETDQTSRDQYMEAFPAGGQYQWNVIVQDRKKSEICSSEVATFSKPVYYPPKQQDDDKKRKK